MRSLFSAKFAWPLSTLFSVIVAGMALCLGGGSASAQVLTGWQPDVQPDPALRANRSPDSVQQPAMPGDAAAKPTSVGIETRRIQDQPQTPPRPELANSAERQVPPSPIVQNQPLPEDTAETSEASAKPQSVEPDMSLARQYCRVVGNDALAAKLTEERRRAEDLKRRIEAKIGELEAATAEQKKWLRLRNEFQEKATDNLVAVYALMDAEAAAQRLTDVTDNVAAAILLKLPAKATSAILAEMQSDKAGRLTAYLAGSADIAGSPATQQATP